MKGYFVIVSARRISPSLLAVLLTLKKPIETSKSLPGSQSLLGDLALKIVKALELTRSCGRNLLALMLDLSIDLEFRCIWQGLFTLKQICL